MSISRASEAMDLLRSCRVSCTCLDGWRDGCLAGWLAVSATCLSFRRPTMSRRFSSTSLPSYHFSHPAISRQSPDRIVS